jgi:hypothetical protein
MMSSKTTILIPSKKLWKIKSVNKMISTWERCFQKMLKLFKICKVRPNSCSLFKRYFFRYSENFITILGFSLEVQEVFARSLQHIQINIIKKAFVWYEVG